MSTVFFLLNLLVLRRLAKHSNRIVLDATERAIWLDHRATIPLQSYTHTHTQYMVFIFLSYDFDFISFSLLLLPQSTWIVLDYLLHIFTAQYKKTQRKTFFIPKSIKFYLCLCDCFREKTTTTIKREEKKQHESVFFSCFSKLSMIAHAQKHFEVSTTLSSDTYTHTHTHSAVRTIIACSWALLMCDQE